MAADRRKLLVWLLAGLLVLASPAGLALAIQAPPVGTPVRAPEPTKIPGDQSGPEPAPRMHVVAEGDTLFSIAILYDVPLETLQAVNNIGPDALIYVGQVLIIPGGTGELVPAVYRVRLGDTLSQVAAAFNTTAAAIADANRLVNPYRLIGGQPLNLVSRTGSIEPQSVTGTPHVVSPGETPLAIAARHNTSLAELAATNNLGWPPRIFPGQRLRLPGDQPFQALPAEWGRVELRPQLAVQGQTFVVYVEHLQPGTPAGQLADQPLRFAPLGDGYVALVGLDAFRAPGVYPLELWGSGPERPWAPFEQPITVASGNYGTQQVTVPQELSALLDPAVRAEEDAFLSTYYGRFSGVAQWDGLFQAPITTTFVSAGYGDARSYNGGPVEIFHSGIDYAAPAGTAVLAPAAGTVIFSQETTLRGNVIIIDHGLGVMTGYYHLAEMAVAPGDQVLPGQLIGRVGNTGLSSGPHLHWEVRVNDIAVDGGQWLREVLP